MKKLILAVLIVGLMATPCLAKEWRVISDLQFAVEADAIAFLNEIEKVKLKARVVETQAGWVSEAKMVESWDTEISNAPENTIVNVNFSTSAVTHVVSGDITQKDIDDKQALIDAKQVKIDDEKAVVALKQKEIDDKKALEAK